jgi:hypothetical protein
VGSHDRSSSGPSTLLAALLVAAIWVVQEFWVGVTIAVVGVLLSVWAERSVRNQRRRMTAALAKLAKEMLPDDGFWMELEQRAQEESPPTLTELWIYNKTLDALIIGESTARALLRDQAEISSARSRRTKADNLSE